MATVLSFDHEVLTSGLALPRPMNYALSRIVPPSGMTTDTRKRPVVVIDPRAGQGPGIGGFKTESEIGDALNAGHPVYCSPLRTCASNSSACLKVIHIRAVAFLHRGRPQHQDIDPVIQESIKAPWPDDASGGMFGAPWLLPRADAFLQLRNNLIRDPLVNVLSHLCLLVCRLRMQPALGQRR